MEYGESYNWDTLRSALVKQGIKNALDILQSLPNPPMRVIKHFHDAASTATTVNKYNIRNEDIGGEGSIVYSASQVHIEVIHLYRVRIVTDIFQLKIYVFFVNYNLSFNNTRLSFSVIKEIQYFI